MKVIITVDTEHPQTPLRESRIKQSTLFNDTHELAGLFKSYDIQATFFLAVDERYIWDDNYISCIIRTLKFRNQDIQLHTHPEWHDPIKRVLMTDYSYKEQFDIIKNGKEYLESHGLNVIAHRSGAYSVDNHTLLALRNNNIPIDMSGFIGHPNTLWYYHIDNLTRIPVSSYYRYFRLKKHDLDWCSFKELKRYVNKSIKRGKEYLVFMMHSYSKDLDKLERYLTMLKMNPEIEIQSVRKYYENN